MGPKAQAKVRVRLWATDKGGRRSAIAATKYRCPVFFGTERAQAHDCMFGLDEAHVTLEPGGASADVPVRFLDVDLIREKLKVGTRLVLWEGHEIGEAEVIEVW